MLMVSGQLSVVEFVAPVPVVDVPLLGLGFDIPVLVLGLGFDVPLFWLGFDVPLFWLGFDVPLLGFEDPLPGFAVPLPGRVELPPAMEPHAQMWMTQVGQAIVKMPPNVIGLFATTPLCIAQSGRLKTSCKHLAVYAQLS